MKIARFGIDEDGDVVFVLFGCMSWTLYKRDAIFEWGDASVARPPKYLKAD